MPDRGLDRYLVKSLVHAASILQAFQSPGEVLRLRDVVERTGFGKGMCFRLLHTLHHCGFVEKTDERHYRLMAVIRPRKRFRIGYASQGQDSSFQETGREATCAVVGQNAEPDARQELRSARTPLVASVAYFPERYGSGLVRLALDILSRKAVPPAVFTRHQIITAENVDHFYPNDSLVGVSSGTAMAADRVSFREAKQRRAR
jgi:IclR helix-turn-helix domain